jgi:hypothetical protein
MTAKKATTTATRRTAAAKTTTTAKRTPAKATPKTYAIETLNRADGSVDGHRAGCRDIARIAKAERLDRSGSWKVTSKRQASLDYNADFIAEADGDEAVGYVINWLPCADHVPATDAPAKATTTKAAPVTKRRHRPMAPRSALVHAARSCRW